MDGDRIRALKNRVLAANLFLRDNSLAPLTWGNASEIDRELGVIAIKPSGVPYDAMTADDIVLIDLDGAPVGSGLRPSSDAPTHVELYRAFPGIGGAVHTHSTYAVAFAQAGRDIPALGTTHADLAHCPVPCARALTSGEVNTEYEKNTGLVIEEHFKNNGISPDECPAVLVRSHGPFTWGADAMKAAQAAFSLEKVAEMAYLTLALGGGESIPRYLADKHYFRKHGKDAYYGQDKK